MKSYRHEVILDIINTSSVDTQDRLKELLSERGITVTQATLSRDIREIGLEKNPDSSGNVRYVRPERTMEEVPAIFREAVIGADHAMNTVVFKCHTGMAQAACMILDRQSYPHIVGTIAGDDTIFILMRTEKDAAAFVSRMRSLIFEQNKGDINAK